MRVLKKSIDKKLPRNRLYLDDLRSIYTILKNHYEIVTIETDEYEISDLDQLRKLESHKSHKLAFYCRQEKESYITTRIYFDKDYTHVSMYEDTTLNRGILAEIEQVVASRKQRITSVLSSNVFFCSFIIICIGLAMWLANIEASTLLILFIFLLLIVYCIYWIWLTSNNYSIVALYERKERPSFFRRNKDRILVGIIVGVIVAIFSVFLTLLLTHN